MSGGGAPAIVRWGGRGLWFTVQVNIEGEVWEVRR